jgi:hypothetical protein
MKISAVEDKVWLSHEWNYIYTHKDILLNNANSPPLLQCTPHLAEVWQYFVITVTAVKVLICIDKLKERSLQEYFRLEAIILNDQAVKQHLAWNDSYDIIM